MTSLNRTERLNGRRPTVKSGLLAGESIQLRWESFGREIDAYWRCIFRIHVVFHASNTSFMSGTINTCIYT